jgi:hypothetical protein
MATPLELFFVDAWEMFLDGGIWDAEDMAASIEKAGLGVWRPVTAEEIAAGGTLGARAEGFGSTLAELEPGDPIMVLTDAGREAVTNARTHTILSELEPGDPIVVLTDAGKAAITKVRNHTKQEVPKS